MSSESLHAPRDRLKRQTITHHQAIVSLMEELDAVDWYRQRADDCEDAELSAILLHNMREEMEHASMLLEWLRRNHTDWNEHFREYLFSEGPILAVEAAVTAREAAGGAGDGTAPDGPDKGRAAPAAAPGETFTIGALKGETR